jgi:hypothetical protein
MKPKEKAKELIDKFSVVGLQQRAEGIECALIFVQEIFELGVNWNDVDVVKDYPKVYEASSTWQYWDEVKKEIKNIQYNDLP